MALAIGGCTIDELKRRISENEFVSWMAFYSKEPFGDRRMDLNFARLAQIQMGLAGQDAELAKLMPEFWPITLSAQDLLAKAKLIFSRLS